MVLLSTNNICFSREIGKIILNYALLSGGHLAFNTKRAVLTLWIATLCQEYHYSMLYNMSSGELFKHAATQIESLVLSYH